MMKFLIERASDAFGGAYWWEENNEVQPTYKEFNTVEELCAFMDEVNQDIIIRRCLDGSKKIVIYDDYVE